MSRATRIAFSVFFAVSLLFSALISALRVMALENFEIKTEYFAHGTRLPDVVNYLLFASVLIFFVCGLYLRGRISLASSDRGVPFYFGNAVLGASLAAYALFSFPALFGGQASSNALISEAFLLLATLFCVAGVFFSVHNCLFPNTGKSLRLLFGLSVPLFAIANVLYLYFDTSSPLNAPNKLFDQFTYVFVALYLLYELRILIAAPRYAAQSALGFITIVFTAVNGFPSFIYMARYGEPLSANAAHDVLMIAFFLYVSIRMAHMLISESARDDRVLDLLTEAEHPAAVLKTKDVQKEKKDESDQITFDTLDAPEIEIIPDEEEVEEAKESTRAPEEDDRPAEPWESATPADDGENA